MDLRAAQLLRQAPGMEDGAGAAHIVLEQLLELVLEILALHDLLVGLGNIVHCLFQMRRHQLATIVTKETVGIGHLSKVHHCCHRLL